MAPSLEQEAVTTKLPRFKPVLPETEDVPLKCGGEAGDELQVALEERKLAYVRWSRERPTRLLAYFSNDIRIVPPWPEHEWLARLNDPNGGLWSLASIDRLENDSDMGAQGWIRLLYLHTNSPNLPAAAAERIRSALTHYRYWIDEPFGGDPNKPQQFWTENHQIMYGAAEFLAGQLMPAATFRDGMTGAQHRDKAHARIDQWLSTRLFHGFNEWNSPVYYEYTFTALLNLVDFSADERIATRAAIALDLLIFDLARFTQKGSFGVTAGRAYAEHKHAGWRQSVGDLIEMLFGTRGRWVYADSLGAHSLATTRKYCVPTALLAIGRDRPDRLTDRSRVSINLGEIPAIGYASDEDGMFWWGKSAYFVGPMVDKSNEMIRKYGLQSVFDAEWYTQIRNLTLPLAGRGNDLLSAFFEGMALTRANLYTYRDRGAMLSSVQAFRVGQVGPQLNPWQVTFDNEVTVFGTYPAALNGGDGPNWWTGTAVIPFVVQRDSAAIAIYSPHPASAQALAFGHRTHLWFPFGESSLVGVPEAKGWTPPGIDTGRFKFDETRIERRHASNDVSGSMWMFGRKGDGYVGIYSAQPCELVTNGAWRGKEIVCDGLRNAFVIQVGSADTFGSFSTFVDACLRARINLGRGLLSPLRPGVDVQVSYDSPDPRARQLNGGYHLEAHFDKREARFNGAVYAINAFPRFDNPYAQVQWGAVDYEIAHDGFWLRHSQQKGVREGHGLRVRPFIGTFPLDRSWIARRPLYVVRPGGELV
ncbi:hypothetical protein JKG68_31125, partial [Microvirga aerilata]|nr:hypothetical protein [Microvirga aerilata]